MRRSVSVYLKINGLSSVYLCIQIMYIQARNFLELGRYREFISYWYALPVNCEA